MSRISVKFFFLGSDRNFCVKITFFLLFPGKVLKICLVNLYKKKKTKACVCLTPKEFFFVMDQIRNNYSSRKWFGNKIVEIKEPLKNLGIYDLTTTVKNRQFSVRLNLIVCFEFNEILRLLNLIKSNV